jgi:hypothetical protein
MRLEFGGSMLSGRSWSGCRAALGARNGRTAGPRGAVDSYGGGPGPRAPRRNPNALRAMPRSAHSSSGLLRPFRPRAPSRPGQRGLDERSSIACRVGRRPLRPRERRSGREGREPHRGRVWGEGKRRSPVPRPARARARPRSLPCWDRTPCELHGPLLSSTLAPHRREPDATSPGRPVASVRSTVWGGARAVLRARASARGRPARACSLAHPSAGAPTRRTCGR